MKALFLSAMAHAQEATQSVTTGAPKQPGALEMMLPFVFVFAIFYFLVIRPQVKRQKTHQKFITELKKGDEVITTSGILGTIEGLTDRFVTLEVSDGVSIKVLRSQVASTLAQQQEVKN
jgi:preprotein translocase subunit YajC